MTTLVPNHRHTGLRVMRHFWLWAIYCASICSVACVPHSLATEPARDWLLMRACSAWHSLKCLLDDAHHFGGTADERIGVGVLACAAGKYAGTLNKVGESAWFKSQPGKKRTKKFLLSPCWPFQPKDSWGRSATLEMDVSANVTSHQHRLLQQLGRERTSGSVRPPYRTNWYQTPLGFRPFCAVSPQPPRP